MKNYDTLMEKMTPEKMAEMNVHLVTVDNKRLLYMTSPGQLFPIDKFEDAVKYELAWLNFNPEDVDTPDENPEKDESKDTNA